MRLGGGEVFAWIIGQLARLWQSEPDRKFCRTSRTRRRISSGTSRALFLHQVQHFWVQFAQCRSTTRSTAHLAPAASNFRFVLLGDLTGSLSGASVASARSRPDSGCRGRTYLEIFRISGVPLDNEACRRACAGCRRGCDRDASCRLSSNEHGSWWFVQLSEEAAYGRPLRMGPGACKRKAMWICRWSCTWHAGTLLC